MKKIRENCTYNEVLNCDLQPCDIYFYELVLFFVIYTIYKGSHCRYKENLKICVRTNKIMTLLCYLPSKPKANAN